jgi:hypothetical protein
MDILDTILAPFEPLRDLWRRVLGIGDDGWREVPTVAKIGPIEVDSGSWGLDIAGVVAIALALYAGKKLIDWAGVALRGKGNGTSP